MSEETVDPTIELATQPLNTTQIAAQAAYFTPAVGREFGDYVLEREIARGGMGVVYQARQRKLNRTVAVKMILSGALASQQEVRRFYTEAEAAAHLDHPGIVPIYEVNDVAGQHFFSMGYVDGESLAHRLGRGPLPPREAAETVRQVALAVAYAHSQGVVHRDLKPANILLTKDGRPRVTDFGLAKTVEGDSGLTASGQILGTPSFMPPEQARGDLQEVGPLSDVYSLGAVLYCTLTGRPPFQAAKVMETLHQVIEREPVSPRVLNPAVDLDLETICLKCLEKEKSHRIESAAALAEELDRYLRGEPIRSRRIGWPTRAARWIKRNRTTAALAGLAPVLLVSVIAAVFFSRRAAESRQFTQWSNAVEAGLDHVELTAEHLQSLEGLIANISPRSPEEAAKFQRRLIASWIAAVEQAIRRPRLEQKEIEQIESALSLLAEREDDEADRLRDLLERRKSQLQPVFHLEAPFDELAAVFAPNQVESGEGKLYLSGRAASEGQAPANVASAELIRTLAVSGRRVQLAAEFDAGWEQGAELGLSLSQGKESGYDFVLRPLPNFEADQQPATGAAAKPAVRPTFAATRDGGGRIAIEIRRRDSLVQRHEAELTEFNPGPLRLRVRRDGSKLTFQINLQKPVVFDDPFPLGAARHGVFAVRWPPQAGLLSLSAQEELRGVAVSALEQADALLEEERFEAALAQYEQFALTSDPALQQEIQFKRGLCLMSLNRVDESAEVFQPLLAQDGDRWPPLAGMHLWLGLLQQNRDADADAVYELLGARYRFDQLALLAPAEVRHAIVISYLQGLESYGDALSFGPEQLKHLERAAAIDRLLSYDGRGEPNTQFQLARGYQRMGDLEAALRILTPMTRVGEQGRIHYLRLLRQTGRVERALKECVSWSDERTSLPVLAAQHWIDLLLIHLALSDWDSAEADVLAGLDFVDDHDGVSYFDQLTQLRMVGGLLRAERGDEPGALSLWREGYREGRPLLNLGRTATGTINVLMMGSLCGELTDDEAWRFFQSATSDADSNPLVAAAKQFLNPTSVGNAFRTMWTTPRGRQVARDFAFDAIPMNSRITAPASLAGYQYVAQAAFVSPLLLPEQDAVVWQAADSSFRGWTEGRLNGAQFIQLGLAWKGTTNLLGWQGVAPTLDPALRASIAYALAHRYVRLSNLPQAERLLQTAVKDSPTEDPLRRLAEDDLQLLRAGQARLRLERHGEADSPAVEVVLSRDGQEAQRVSVESVTEVDLLPGRYGLALAASAGEFQFTAKELTLAPADRAVIALEPAWKPASPSPLVGLLPATADLPDLGRWQVHDRAPLKGVGLISQSPDGQWTAAADSWPGGAVRIYDAGLQLHKILPVDTPAVLAIGWSPDGRRLAIARAVPIVDLWDPVQGKLVRQFTGLPAEVRSLAWSDAGDRLALGASDGSISVWSASGRRLATLATGAGWITAMAWKPGGDEIVFAAQSPPQLLTWSMVEEDAAPLAGAEGRQILDLAFSPQGRRLAGVTSGKVAVWDWSTKKRTHRFTIPDTNRGAAAWDPSEGIVWARASGGIYRCDLSSDQNSAPSKIELRESGSLSFDPRQRHFTTADSGDLVRLTESGEVVCRATWFPTEIVRDIAFHPTGDRFVTVADSRRLRWLDRRGILLRQIDLPANPYCLAWQPGGTEIAVACEDGKIRLFRDEDGALVREWQASTQSLRRIAYHPQGAALASCGDDGTVRIWSREGAAQGTLAADAKLRGQFHVLAYSPAGNRLLAVTQEGDVFLADDQGKLVRQFALERTVHAAAWRRDGAKFVLAFDGELRLFSPEGEAAGTIVVQSAPIVACAWDNAGRIVAIDHGGGTHVLSEEDEIQSLGAPGGHGGRASFAFDPQIEQAVAWSWNRRLEGWKLADGRPTFTAIPLADQVLTFDGLGRLQNEQVTDIAPLTYVVETPEGFQMLTHQQFLEKAPNSIAK